MTSPSRSVRVGLVGLVEADPQELLARPLAEPLGQLGEALGGAQRGERRLHQAAQPVDDGVAVALQLLQLVGQDAQPGLEGGGPGGGVLGQRGGGQFADLLAGRGADLLVAGGVGVADQDVARLADGGLGGRAGRRSSRAGSGGPRRRTAGPPPGCPGTARAARPPPRPWLWSRSRSRSSAAVSSKPPAASSAARWAARSSAWAARAVSNASVRAASSAVAVRSSAWACSASAGTWSSGSSVCALAVGGCQAFGLAAQPAELLARGGRPGLQHLYERLGAGGGRLAGGAVRAVGAFEQGGGAGAHLVGEPVELGEGRALVALGAGLLGAQVGADADLLVQLGRGAVGLAQGGQRGARGVRVGLRQVFGGARDLGALGAQRAGGAVGVVGGALGGAAVLVGGLGALQDAWARASDSAASSASSRSLTCQPARSRSR